MTMYTKTTIMLAIASLLTVNAAAMAATKHNHKGVTQSEAVLNARAQAPDGASYNYEGTYDPSTLFDRAKGNIE
jgi:hypothetical protein